MTGHSETALQQLGPANGRHAPGVWDGMDSAIRSTGRCGVFGLGRWGTVAEGGELVAWRPLKLGSRDEYLIDG